MRLRDDPNAQDQEAVADLRAALLSGTGAESALRALSDRYMVFLSFLFTRVAQLRFGASPGLSQVAAFTSRVRPVVPGEAFPARQAELILRISLGEPELAAAIEPAELDYIDTMVTLLRSMLDEWRPEQAEIDDLLDQVEATAEQLRGLAPDVLPAVERWVDQVTETGPADPADHEAISDRATAHLNADRYEEALADFTLAIGLTSGDWKAMDLIGRGMTYLRLERNEEALADFSQSLAIRPDSEQALELRADAYHNLGRFDEALADYDAAIELNPDDVWAIKGRADTYLALGRAEAAAADLARAAELDPP